LTEIVGIRFKSGGKIYFFDPAGKQVEEGAPVIVETARGLEFGKCVQRNTMVEDSEVTAPLRAVVRIATEEDQSMREANRKKEGWAMEVCQQKIADHKLEMKLVNVQYNFDGSKILFFFTSDGRVDFRELVKDLASVFRTRIELRQIGVRDEAKMLGGLGICGQPFCCNRFLDDFQPVSIKMAKTQNLSLNPTKISGTCGRLMCCLKYEQEAYEDLVKRAPKQDSFVETPDGVGTVSGVQLLREQTKVRLDIAPETPKCYGFRDIKVIRSGKGKRPDGYETQEELQAAHIRKTMEQAREERKAAELAAQKEKAPVRREKRTPPGSHGKKWENKGGKEARPLKEAEEGARETKGAQKEPREGKGQKPFRGTKEPRIRQGQKPQGDKAKHREEGVSAKAQEKRRYPHRGHGKSGSKQGHPPKEEKGTGQEKK
jgi:cell fate regulator YaaT (PSP1 superfamily)